jgi:thiol-disulfide isomerase/thioredoxin
VSKKGRRDAAPQRQTPRRRPQSSFWRGPWPIVGTLAGLVVIVIILIVISRASTPNPAGGTSPTADPAVVNELEHVSASVIDSVGTGGSANPLTHQSASLLTGAGGKPEMFYAGAEWCPYCAAERWAMVVALGHFGTFTGLHFTTSSSSDVFPDTHTLSFAGSTYTSSYLDFVPVELEDRNHNPLQSPTSQQQTLMSTYDPNGSIPFIDIGNQYTMVGQGVLPNSLQGLSWQQIAGALSDANSPVTKAIVGQSNYLTAAICKLPGASSAPICSDPTISQIASQLK